ncbi:MAG: hypothetical protein KAU22_05725 [Desulfuromonadales bacterium]|nr:hypothetical protein [Desulfuromonadales bacterium]
MGSGYMWSNGMGYFPMIMPIMMLIIFLVAVYFLFGRGNHSLRDQKGEESALDILKRRYAKGEIQKEKFEAMKKDLK